MADSTFNRREDIRLWCLSVGAKRVYQSNAKLRTLYIRLGKFEEATGLKYPGPGKWGRDESLEGRDSAW